ncbi:MAG: AAA family ATPase [Candidatus Ranarchaeia archaeon]
MNSFRWGTIRSGVSIIDGSLGGGIAPGNIVHIYGPTGAGKTTLALQFAVTLGRQGGTSLYLSSSGNFAYRLKQIAGKHFNGVSERIVVFRPRDFNEQSNIIDRLESFITASIGLIVVDTITGLYRRALESKEQTLIWNQELNRQVAFLAGIARDYGVAVLLVNDVTQWSEQKDMQPVAKSILSYWSNITLQLLHLDPPELRLRRLYIKTHKHMKRVKILLTDKGLVAA